MALVVAVARAPASNVLLMVTDGAAEVFEVWMLNDGTDPPELTLPILAFEVTVLPSKKRVPPKLCGMVIWLSRRKAGLLLVIEIVTLPGARRLPVPSSEEPLTLIVPASAKIGLMLMNGTTSDVIGTTVPSDWVEVRFSEASWNWTCWISAS